MGVVVFGYGNPSRGDDALGPLLLDRAEGWLSSHPGAGILTIADFQLQIEHALDLEGCVLALFVDADVSCTPPFEFRSIRAARDESYTTHELSPEALLQVFRKTFDREPPPAFVLSVRGERFELGDPLSPAAEENLEAAWRFLETFLGDPEEVAAASGGKSDRS